MAADIPFSQQKYGVPEGLQRVNCHFNPEASPSTACFVWGTGLCAPVLVILCLSWRTIGLSTGHFVRTLNRFWKKILPFFQHILRKWYHITSVQFTIYISDIFLPIWSLRGFEKTCGLLQGGENLREARRTVRETRRAGSWGKSKVK